MLELFDLKITSVSRNVANCLPEDTASHCTRREVLIAFEYLNIDIILHGREWSVLMTGCASLQACTPPRQQTVCLSQVLTVQLMLTGTTIVPLMLK